jgi:hypothetical protein
VDKGTKAHTLRKAPRMGTRRSSDVHGVSAAGACQRYSSAPCACGVVGSGFHRDWPVHGNGCGSMLSGSVRLLRLSALRRSAGWGELCFSSGTCGWLTRLLSEMFWRVVVWLLSQQWSRVGNACGLWFIRLLGRGLLCSRPFPKLPPPSGLPCMILPGMIGQSQQRP